VTAKVVALLDTIWRFIDTTTVGDMITGFEPCQDRCMSAIVADTPLPESPPPWTVSTP
jgi:hypothetical protein